MYKEIHSRPDQRWLHDNMAILPPHASGALFLWQVPGEQLIPETWMCDDQISQKLPEAGAQWTGPSAVALPICSGLICMESKPGLAFPPLHLPGAFGRLCHRYSISLRESHQLKAFNVVCFSRSALSTVVHLVIRPRSGYRSWWASPLSTVFTADSITVSHQLVDETDVQAHVLAHVYVCTCRLASQIQRCLTLQRMRHAIT